MSRRSLLLAYLVNSYKWLPYSYEYLYNSLIPETISGKGVKNKAKVSKIYANGVIENQLNDLTKWTRTSFGGINITINGNQITFNGTWDGTTNLSNTYLTQSIDFFVNHKYLMKFKHISGNISGTGNIFIATSDYVQCSVCIFGSGTTNLIGTANQTISNNIFRFKSNNLDATNPISFNNYTFTVELIDLTLMFGTGNEPTALTDNRIQALLNRGYIAYNTGTYKGTDIGVISTKDSNNADLDTLTFIYQGNGALNSHDTFEITSTEYVFTKNNTRVDLGSLDYSYISSGYFVSTELNPAIKIKPNDQIVNAMCPEYLAITRNDFSATLPNKTMRVDNNQSTPKMYFVNRTYTDATAFKTAMTGVMLYYELATPQVIRIPKKHLGIVKIRDLSWTYHSLGFCYASITGKKDFNNQNLYCSPFMLTDASVSTMPNLSMKAVSVLTQQNVAIKDTSISNTTDFVNKYGDYYIFYETENEVSDIADMIDIEKGGTITSNSQVLPNVDFNIKCK